MCDTGKVMIISKKDQHTVSRAIQVRENYVLCSRRVSFTVKVAFRWWRLRPSRWWPAARQAARSGRRPPSASSWCSCTSPARPLQPVPDYPITNQLSNRSWSNLSCIDKPMLLKWLVYSKSAMCWQMHLVRMLGPELGKKLLQVGNEVTDLIVGDGRWAGATRLMLLPGSRPSPRHHCCYVVRTESGVPVKVEEEEGSGEGRMVREGTEGKRYLVREYCRRN